MRRKVSRPISASALLINQTPESRGLLQERSPSHSTLRYSVVGLVLRAPSTLTAAAYPYDLGLANQHGCLYKNNHVNGVKASVLFARRKWAAIWTAKTVKFKIKETKLHVITNGTVRGSRPFHLSRSK